MVSWKGGLALLVVLAALVLYIVVSGRRQAPPPSVALIPCSPVETVAVTVTGPNGATAMERADNRSEWQIVSPAAAPAAQDRVDNLISAIDSVRVLNTLPSPPAEADTGFARPRLTVSCRVAAGASYTLTVGNQNFDGSGYYAHKGGDNRVYVVSGIEVDAFDRVLQSPPVKPIP
ncbi:MAG: DUF4340 domain-containing protein [Candidatus Dormibacteraeota bacterium]|nr:DUF4340 domain-containing protein [Candidatus Dormibacteraeota bacterium]